MSLEYWKNPTNHLDREHFCKDRIMISYEDAAIAKLVGPVDLVLDLGTQKPNKQVLKACRPGAVYACFDGVHGQYSEEVIDVPYMAPDGSRDVVVTYEPMVLGCGAPWDTIRGYCDSLDTLSATVLVLMKRLLCNLNETECDDAIALLGEIDNYLAGRKRQFIIIDSDADIYEKMVALQPPELRTKCQHPHPMQSLLRHAGFSDFPLASKYVYVTRILYPNLFGAYLGFDDLDFRRDVVRTLGVNLPEDLALVHGKTPGFDAINPYRVWTKRVAP